MTARLITAEEQQVTVSAFCTVAEAAERLGVSKAKVRRAAYRLGVKKLHGRGVAGFILFDDHPVPVSVSYTE